MGVAMAEDRIGDDDEKARPGEGADVFDLLFDPHSSIPPEERERGLRTLTILLRELRREADRILNE